MKSKTAAALFAIFLGSIGAHKFYLGHFIWGFLYLCLSWTGIPAFVGFIEGVLYLIQDQHRFDLRYNSQFLLMNANQNLIQQNAPSHEAAPQKSVAEQLEELNQLHIKGAITEKEFKRLKKKLIS